MMSCSGGNYPKLDHDVKYNDSENTCDVIKNACDPANVEEYNSRESVPIYTYFDQTIETVKDSKGGKTKRFSQRVVNEQRSTINNRERRRMHQLNSALEELRRVMPTTKAPSIRKLSKVATLTLARDYIQMLSKSVDDMKHLLDNLRRSGRYVSLYGSSHQPHHFLPTCSSVPGYLNRVECPAPGPSIINPGNMNNYVNTLLPTQRHVPHMCCPNDSSVFWSQHPVTECQPFLSFTSQC